MGWITQVAIVIVATTTDGELSHHLVPSSQTLPLVLLALRVYAMYGKSKAVLGATSIFIISALAYNAWVRFVYRL